MTIERKVRLYDDRCMDVFGMTEKMSVEDKARKFDTLIAWAIIANSDDEGVDVCGCISKFEDFGMTRSEINDVLRDRVLCLLK